MASKSRTSFQKRQKEIARMEKQREKAAKRFSRKLAKQAAGTQGPPIEEADQPSAPSDATE
jgi:hypothetical protein